MLIIHLFNHMPLTPGKIFHVLWGGMGQGSIITHIKIFYTKNLRRYDHQLRSFKTVYNRGRETTSMNNKEEQGHNDLRKRWVANHSNYREEGQGHVKQTSVNLLYLLCILHWILLHPNYGFLHLFCVLYLIMSIKSFISTHIRVEFLSFYDKLLG